MPTGFCLRIDVARCHDDEDIRRLACARRGRTRSTTGHKRTFDVRSPSRSRKSVGISTAARAGESEAIGICSPRRAPKAACVDGRQLPSGCAELVFRATQPGETRDAVPGGIRAEDCAACLA